MVDEATRTLIVHRASVVVAVNFGAQEATLDLGAEHEPVWATPGGASVTGREVVLPPHAGALLTRLG